ncbi:hypothetical protein CR513_11954, partial [Mucuna pruriens]
MSLRRSIRERRYAILDDYIVFLQEHKGDIGLTEDDTINFCQAKQSSNSQKLIDAIKDEMKSIYSEIVLKFPNNDLKRNEMQNILHALTGGSLMYAQVCTRPDIAFVVGVLGMYLSDPGMQHLKAIKRLGIIGYSDFNFEGCQVSKRSTFGYIYMLARGAISWKSVKQTLIAPSTMTVEFVACFETSNHGIWLRNFVISLRVVDGIERPLKIYRDNNSAFLYSNNNRSSTNYNSFIVNVQDGLDCIKRKSKDK